jgi:PadR family transcriptional regulator PadR
MKFYGSWTAQASEKLPPDRVEGDPQSCKVRTQGFARGSVSLTERNAGAKPVSPLERLRLRMSRVSAKTNSDQIHGTLDMLALKTLAVGPLHGYAIAVRLERLSGDVLKVEEGSLYPALYRMEQRGWLTSEWSTTDTGRRARFYRLTRAGRVQLAAEAASWDRLSVAVRGVMNA